MASKKKTPAHAREVMLRGMVESSTGAQLIQTTTVSLPELQVPSLEGLSVQVDPPPPVDEGDVVLAFESLRREHAAEEELPPGHPVALGDEVELDTIGYLEGRVVPFSVQSGVWYRLGEDPWLPGLSDGLLGAKVGEAEVVSLPLPDDYMHVELRGRTLDLACTLRAARRVELPAPTDPAFLEATGYGDSLDAVMAALVEELGEQRADERAESARNLALDALLSRTAFEVPRELIDDEIRRRWSRAEGEAMRQWELSAEEQKEALLGWLEDPLTFADAHRRVALAMLLGALVKQEDIVVDEEDLDAFLEGFTEAVGGSAEEARAALEKEPKHKETVMNQLLHIAAVEHVVARTEVLFSDDE